jgi:hypothetical protein
MGGPGLHRHGADLSSLNLNYPLPNISIPGFNTPREAQYARRVKELEDELRHARLELEKVVSGTSDFGGGI